MKIVPKAGVPKEALRKWNVGDIAVHLNGVYGEAPNDSMMYKDLKIYYYDKLKVRPDVLYKQLRFHPSGLILILEIRVRKSVSRSWVCSAMWR